MQHDLVRADPVVEPVRCSLERALEPGVRERLDLAAAVADEMVMVVMLAARVGGLEPGDPVADVDPQHEAKLYELVKRAVDARDPHASPSRADPVEDLLG